MTARAHRLLSVPLLRQRNDHECGPTALAAIAQHHGLRVAPADLARLAGTTADGTDHANLVAVAEAFHTTVIARDGGTIDELVAFVDRGVPVMVGWWSMSPGDRHFDPAWSLADRIANDRGHYSVVCGVTPAGLVLMDPDEGTTTELADAAFLAVWYDTDTAAYDRVDRWFLCLPR